MIPTVTQITWNNGSKISYESFYSEGKNAVNNKPSLIAYFKGFNNITEWKVIDKNTKEIIASSDIELELTKEEKARIENKNPKKKRQFSKEHKRKIAEALRKRHKQKKEK